MYFSLILATLNRTQEVDSFLNTLLKQTYTNFEVIMIDQNDDDRLMEIVKKYERDFSLQHIRSSKGLSHARNIGLHYVKGDIVAFPDDDCLYPAILLENISNFFSREDYSVLMGKTIDKEDGSVVAGKSVMLKKELSCYQFLGSSTTMFIDVTKLDKQEIAFDEVFGLGAMFCSGEEEDLMIRLLEKGNKGFYDPEINFVYHPPSDLDFTDVKRAKTRAVGMGALIGKHFLSLCGLFYFMKYAVAHPIISLLASMLKMDKILVVFHLYRTQGVWSGLFRYSIMRLGNKI